MLTRLGRFALRRRWAILAATLAAVALAGAFGGGAIGHLKSGGFDDPAAESVKAAATLRDSFGTGDPNLVLLVTARHGDVDDPVVARRGADLTRRLAAEPDLTQVASYWSVDAPSLRSEDGRQALVLGRVTGDEEALDERARQLTAAYTADGPDVRVQVGGQIQVFREVGEQVERDLVRADGIAVPVTLLLLRLLGDLTDVSIYALNLTTALGFGLAIDYSLFIVSRYREELRAGREPADALLATMATAGRTVLFSAATVAVSLVALLVFPLYFLRSFGYAGIAVVALAAVGALVVLPALLAVLGRRVDRLPLPIRRRRATRPSGAARPAGAPPWGSPDPARSAGAPPWGSPDPSGGGFWHRLATGVMRRPLPIAVV